MIDSKKCPFCKKDNMCEANNSSKVCWCSNLVIPEELKEYLPNEYKMKACICKECITLFKEKKEQFIQKYT